MFPARVEGLGAVFEASLHLHLKFEHVGGKRSGAAFFTRPGQYVAVLVDDRDMAGFQTFD